jgi:hypothetical protein
MSLRLGCTDFSTALVHRYNDFGGRTCPPPPPGAPLKFQRKTCLIACLSLRIWANNPGTAVRGK